jgi:hypothetical protein
MIKGGNAVSPMMAQRLALIRRAVAKHLAQLETQGVSLRCPVCANTDFSVEHTISTVPIWNEPEPMITNGPQTVTTVPRLPLVCNRCYHVVEFAWLPIRTVLETK